MQCFKCKAEISGGACLACGQCNCEICRGEQVVVPEPKKDKEDEN